MSVPHVGHLRVLDPVVAAVPSPDGFTAYVPISPSPRTEVRAYGTRAGVLIVWSPELGWDCEQHPGRPCEHTEALNNPGKR